MLALLYNAGYSIVHTLFLLLRKHTELIDPVLKQTDY